jgi:hypothetical protein
VGCDIHLVLEKRDPNRRHRRWVGIRDYRIFHASLLEQRQTTESVIPHVYACFHLSRRNYTYFNDLCGVRGDGSTFGYQERGLPQDASDLTQLVLGDDNDLHSHSWLTMGELEPVLNKHWPELTSQSVAAALEGRRAPNLIETLVDNHIGDDEYNDRKLYRLVFAFDN